MRKRVLAAVPVLDNRDNNDAPDGRAWLNLQELAEVEVTSEAEGYPIESAFNFGTGPGWRAASPGRQRIRLTFDQPQSITNIRLRFRETEHIRSQEFTMRWSSGPREPFQEIVRQQWNFSPAGSTVESEEYTVDLKAVSVLELALDPDRGADRALASLADWRIA